MIRMNMERRHIINNNPPQPNMDAELFVRIGKPMDPLFMQRVDEMVFGAAKTCA